MLGIRGETDYESAPNKKGKCSKIYKEYAFCCSIKGGMRPGRSKRPNGKGYKSSISGMQEKEKKDRKGFHSQP